jgi:16S rRNA (uracil1498-N3)-methyltransferase
LPPPHFFVEPGRGIETGSRISLSPEDSQHALRSLRLRPGDAVSLSDDDGTVATGRLVAGEGGLAVIEVDEARRVVRRGTLVSVAMAPPKGDRLAWAVQKLAELGVDELILLRSVRTVREWTGERSDRALRRLEAVAREAAMQSRQPFVMRVVDILPLDDVVAVRGAVVVVLDPSAVTPLSACLPPEATAARLVIGPEGGLTEEELERTRELGARVGALGESILRTETAAVAGAALALHRYGRLG